MYVIYISYKSFGGLFVMCHDPKIPHFIKAKS